MVLTGTFARSIDDKLRLAIPKPLREALASEPKTPLYVAPGADGSLAIYPQAALDQMAQRLAQSSPTAVDVRAYVRLFYARAQRVELDGQGRIRLSAELVEHAKLEKQAVLIGVGDRLELWDAVRWQAYLQERREQYDQLAEAAFAPHGEKEK
jgi:MraZ protein